MKEFISKLGGRKFVSAAATAISAFWLAYQGHVPYDVALTAGAGLLALFIGAEGAADVASRFRSKPE